MIHDITHCSNEHCEDKYTCKRYLAYSDNYDAYDIQENLRNFKKSMKQ